MQLGVDAESGSSGASSWRAALLTGSVVAFTGPIGFVGLIVPHLLRGDARAGQPAARPHGAGGRRRSSCSRPTRWPATSWRPAELSVGVITSFCGAPFFVYLLRTRYRASL